MISLKKIRRYFIVFNGYIYNVFFQVVSWPRFIPNFYIEKNKSIKIYKSEYNNKNNFAQTPENRQGLERFLNCRARKKERTCGLRTTSLFHDILILRQSCPNPRTSVCEANALHLTRQQTAEYTFIKYRQSRVSEPSCFHAPPLHVKVFKCPPNYEYPTYT